MSGPDVSIVVTTHDRPEWLTVALHSILASAATVKVKTEVIVMDDASETPGALIACSKMGIQYRLMRDHSGYAAARVKALEYVDSRYLAFVDDDDYLLPRWFRLNLTEIEQGHDVVASSFWETDAELRQTKQVVLQQATFEGLLSGHCPVNDGALVRTEALQGIPWHPERDKVMMFSMWLALAAHGKSFGVVEEPVWLHRLHGSNMSSHLDEQDAAYRAEAIAEWSQT